MASNDAAGAFDVHSLVGTHARFKYEDGRWYWGVIDGFSDTLSKIHVCLTDKDRKWHSVAPTPAPGAWCVTDAECLAAEPVSAAAYAEHLEVWYRDARVLARVALLSRPPRCSAQLQSSWPVATVRSSRDPSRTSASGAVLPLVSPPSFLLRRRSGTSRRRSGSSARASARRRRRWRPSARAAVRVREGARAARTRARRARAGRCCARRCCRIPRPAAPRRRAATPRRPAARRRARRRTRIAGARAPAPARWVAVTFYARRRGSASLRVACVCVRETCLTIPCVCACA